MNWNTCVSNASLYIIWKLPNIDPLCLLQHRRLPARHYRLPLQKLIRNSTQSHDRLFTRVLVYLFLVFLIQSPEYRVSENVLCSYLFYYIHFRRCMNGTANRMLWSISFMVIVLFVYNKITREQDIVYSILYIYVEHYIHCSLCIEQCATSMAPSSVWWPRGHQC